jgi:hypothetical protein
MIIASISICYPHYLQNYNLLVERTDYRSEQDFDIFYFHTIRAC